MKQQGFIAISTVMILLVVTLAIATSVTLLAIGEMQSAFAVTQGEDTLQFVEGCMEDALLKIRNDVNYAGGTITRPEGSCLITIVSVVGNIWTIRATNQSLAYKRTIEVICDRGSAGITLTSWLEIAP